MIDINLKFQVALIGSYEDISPKPDTLKFLIDAFSDKELIPTTFQELSETGVINRLSLKSSDEVWSIEFSTNRIDIQKNNKDIGVVNMQSLEQFIIDSKEIITILDSKYPKKHNRLGLTSRYLLKKMTKEEITDIYHKTTKSIDFYQQNEPVEWFNRVVSRVPVVMKTSELTNVVSEMNRIKGNLKVNSKLDSIDRIEMKFDINTYQGNNDFRFGIDDVILFIDNAYKIENEIKEKYLNLIS